MTATTSPTAVANPHPFLSGLHVPMHDEFTLTDLPVTGSIPVALNGRYVRIGPNPIAPDPKNYHWFTGDGMLHGLALENGRARWYRNRWIRSNSVAAALGEPPAPGPRFGPSDVVNTNIVGFANRNWALVEAGSPPVEVNDEFEAQRYNPFDGSLNGSFSAHPHLDPATGELHAIAYTGGILDAVRHVVVSAAGNVVRDERISVVDGPSIHDCAVTSKYIVILDLPVTFSLEAARAGESVPYRWNAGHRARVGLLPRSGSDADIIWCDVDPCYVFHTANAWDCADGSVVLDLVAYETMFSEWTGGPHGPFLGVERWTIQPASRRVARRTIDPAAQEFPRFDERRTAQPYRYLYTIAVDSVIETLGTRLYKHDLESGTRAVHDFGPGHVPGEFVFVPNPNQSAEDAGWMVGLVIGVVNDTTDFVILDAADFAGDPVAVVRLPHRVPPGFHGNWIPAVDAA